MKAEINIENKAKFIALYTPYGEIWKKSNEGHQLKVATGNICLNLTPLSLISEKNAFEVGLMNGCTSDNSEAFIISFGKATVNQWMIKKPLNSFTADYLRSKNYALPWMGLTVEEMIEARWIQLQA